MTYTTIICKKLNNKLPFNLHHIINRSENSDGFYFYKKYIFIHEKWLYHLKERKHSGFEKK